MAAEHRVQVFEWPLPGGGQIKMQIHGAWSTEDCDEIGELLKLAVRSMRRAVDRPKADQAE